jgi:hypothetical protein
MKKLVPLFVLIASTPLFMSSLKNSTVSNERKTPTITRIWRGWTSQENAAAFEKTLTEIAIPGIEKNKPNGCLAIQLLKRASGTEVEFTTIMLFNSIDAVKAFAGEDYASAHVDPEVKPLLLRYDVRVAHHETLYTKVWEQK